MIEWTNSIPVGTELNKVKNNQPDYLEIDWKNPEIKDSVITRYCITKIKGYYDILKMEYFLEFKNNEFRGQFGRK